MIDVLLPGMEMLMGHRLRQGHFISVEIEPVVAQCGMWARHRITVALQQVWRFSRERRSRQRGNDVVPCCNGAAGVTLECTVQVTYSTVITEKQ
jgi:hypothetical protein